MRKTEFEEEERGDVRILDSRCRSVDVSKWLWSICVSGMVDKIDASRAQKCWYDGVDKCSQISQIRRTSLRQEDLRSGLWILW